MTSGEFGQVPWNKGKKLSKEHKNAISMGTKKNLPSTSFKKGLIPWNKGLKGFNARNKHYRYGKHCSEETKQKISLSNKGKLLGKNNPFYGKKHSKEVFEKISKTFFKKGHKMRLGSKGWKQTEDAKRKIRENWNPACLKRKGLMSSLEKQFNELVISLNLPYRFVGNGDFLIGRKCPDFINTNGEKIAIEVYYRGHKEKFRNGLEQWKKERQELFSQYGWKIEFFDETQVKEDIVKKRLC